MTPKNTRDYASFDAPTYKTLNEHQVGSNLQDNDSCYLVEK